jgi:uncharacterized protein
MHDPASLVLASALAACCAASLSAASVAEWQGEWGEYTHVGDGYLGGELQVSACDASSCQASVTISKSSGHGGGSGKLTALDDSSARLVLGGQNPQSHACTLRLEMGGAPAQRYVDIREESGDCGYFATAPGIFSGRLPFRSTQLFVGGPAEECFIGGSAARMSLCLSPVLADLDKRWWGVFWALQDQVGLTREEGNEQHRQILAQCDAPPDSGACLQHAYTSAIEALQTRQQAWQAGVTQRGDPQDAVKLMAKIEGAYERSFESGLVDGSTYTATDRLTIARASDSAIQFSVHLNFYNGHECNLEGQAVFKQNGHFVYTEKAGQDKEACIFEIAPGADAIALRDPNGTCRQLSCGVRGGYNGASFPLASRK